MIQRLASRVRTLLKRRSRAASRTRAEGGDIEIDDASFDPYQVPQMAVVA